jgi:glycosyltransferase involved in cell wall biosynthesis
MSRSTLTTACLINHYNYGDFIGDAVAGALRQTRAFDEILVVDDGSRPEHLARVREACAGARIHLIEKPNGGQLSCFNLGFERTTADIVCFLDADDYWDAGYLEAVLGVYERRPDVGFIAAAKRCVHNDGRVVEQPSADRDLGYSVVRCHRRPYWVGAQTSCISARREVLARFLPYEALGGWRICADECLVVGSSLAGARKYELGAVYVNYRVHGGNAFHGRQDLPSDQLQRRLEGMRLCELLRRRLGLPDNLAAYAPLEFRTLQEPRASEYREYCRVVADSGLGWGSKLRARFALWNTYCLGRKREQVRAGQTERHVPATPARSK